MITPLEADQKPLSYDELYLQLMEKDQLLMERDQQLKELQEAHQLLQEQLNWFKRQLFGRKSEKQYPPSNGVLYLPGFEPPSEEAKQEESSEEEQEWIKKKKGKKRRSTSSDSIKLPEDLPVEEVYCDLSEKEKVCPVTGKPLIRIGEEISTKLCKRAATFYIKRIIRPKYASPAKKEQEQPIFVAEGPESFLPGCCVDESVLAHLCVSKYGDHQPLYRVGEIWGRQGVEISRQALTEWVLKSGEGLFPLYQEMCKQVKRAKALHIDESPVKCLGKKKGKAHQAYGWLLVGEVRAGVWYSTYHFKMSREHEHAEALLDGYGGYVHSDKYEAYEKLAKRGKIHWCPCWVHIRRKFIEATTGLEVKRHVLKEIGELFALEREAWSLSEEGRLRLRVEKEEPIIDGLISLAKERRGGGKDLPKSKMAQALNYFCDLEPYLKNYMKSAHARLDNNPVERQVRPLALGRKNWLFFGGDRGALAAGVLFSLVQSCRMMGIDPEGYLEDVMRRLGSHPYHRLEELLPDYWAESRGVVLGESSSVLFSEWKKRAVVDRRS